VSTAPVDTSDRKVAPLRTPPTAEHRPAAKQQPAATSPRWSPARLAYWFYAVAAAGAVIGQTWVAVTHVPWGPQVPDVLRVVTVLPFALCLELLAMALAAMAGERMRLGERAYGFRIFSAVVAAVAVAVLVAGHWPHLYWSGGFGVLSGSAYALWLLHSAARRRAALRAADKLADTAPGYGPWRRLRHPVWTARAAELAREGHVDAHSGGWRPLGLYESLRAAQLAMRDEKRLPVIARAVEQVVRADQRDARMAEVAVRTLDLDRLAAELAGRVDYGGWADRLAPAVTAPVPAPPVTAPLPTAADSRQLPAGGGAASPAPVSPTGALSLSGGRASAPRGRSTAERVARMLADSPEVTVAAVAATLGVSERTVRRYWSTPNGHNGPRPAEGPGPPDRPGSAPSPDATATSPC